MNDTLSTALVSVGATLLTNLIVHWFSYRQKKLELQNQKDIKEIEFRNTNLLNNKSLYLETFQHFCSISGKTVSCVDVRNSDDNPVSLDTIAEFDDIFYKTYVLLTTDEERHTFQLFRNTLRSLAGYPNPEGLFIWDIIPDDFDPTIIEEPRYIFHRLNECLAICHKHISANLYTDHLVSR